MCASAIDPTCDVVVVGAGVAGLVAAHDLARAGLRVTVLERAEHVGGRLRAAQLAGLPVELGAESFATRGGVVAELIGELGLADSIVSPRAHPAWAVTESASYRLPASGALGIPVHPLAAESRRALGLRGALRAASEPWRRRSVHTPGASLAEVVRERLGERTLDRLVAPVTEGVYSASPQDLRVEAHPELARAYAQTGSLLRAARAARASRSAAGGAVQSLVGGISVLVSRLVSQLQDHGAVIRTGVQGLALERSGTEWTARWAGGSCRAAAVVLAVPPHEIERLLGDGAAHDAAREDAAETRVDTQVETVALVLTDARLDRAPRGTGVLVRPGHPRIAAKALTHASAKWDWLEQAAAPGTHVLRLSYGSRDVLAATATEDDDEAARRALRDSGHILGLTLDPSSVAASARARWRIPARAETPSCPPGVVVTGDAYAGTGLASVVPHARAAARAVLAAVTETNHTFHTFPTFQSRS